MKRFVLALASALVVAGCTGPILPARSKPGGSVKWGEVLATQKAIVWSTDATLVRVGGTSVGIEGWLPDRGGEWQFVFVSQRQKLRMEYGIDSDGKIREKMLALGPPATPIPAGWIDSPKVWLAAREHWTADPVHTLDAELGVDIEPERAAGRLVWRLRFWMPNSKLETHIVSADGNWIAMY